MKQKDVEYEIGKANLKLLIYFPLVIYLFGRLDLPFGMWEQGNILGVIIYLALWILCLWLAVSALITLEREW